ncbi:hypothetical protein [Lysobacter terrae]
MSGFDHGLPWSAQQCEWLTALGHDVLMPASMATAPSEPEPLREPAPAPTRAARMPAAATASPLLRALARAAGRDEQDAEFRQALPDLATLRGNPAARRALWPSLRALRRRRPG